MIAAEEGFPSGRGSVPELWYCWLHSTVNTILEPLD